MPLNWKGKKDVSPKKAAKGVKANKPAKETLQAKPGNQGSKMADAAIARSKASHRSVDMPKPSSQRRTK